MAKLESKIRDFWGGLREWEVITLMETWTDEKEWNRRKKSLPRGYMWEGQKAT